MESFFSLPLSAYVFKQYTIASRGAMPLARVCGGSGLRTRRVVTQGRIGNQTGSTS